MRAVKRAALNLAIKRYTKAKKKSKLIALNSLVAEGTHTADGKIRTEYGGEIKKRASSKTR